MMVREYLSKTLERKRALGQLKIISVKVSPKSKKAREAAASDNVEKDESSDCESDSDLSEGFDSNEEYDTLTLHELAPPISVWHRQLADVYKIFKIDRYTVHPNYLLHSSHELKHLTSVTVEEVLSAKAQKSHMTKWSEFVKELQPVLSIFDGWEELTQKLKKKSDKGEENSETDISLEGHFGRNFKKAYLGNSSNSTKIQLDCLKESLDSYCCNPDEEACKKFMRALLFIFSCINGSPCPLTKWDEKVRLYFPRKRMQYVKLDALLSTMCRPCVGCIVVEVNASDTCNECDESAKRRSGESVGDNPRSSRVQPPKNMTACSETKAGSSQAVAGKLGRKKEAEGNKDDDALGSSQSKEKKWIYRVMNEKEKASVKCFLPKLFAGMLAALQQNDSKALNVGENWENVIFGISMVGHKARFLSLTIKNGNVKDAKPRVAELAHRGVKCDLFVTPEIFMLEKSHLKIFFQLLFGILYQTNDQ